MAWWLPLLFAAGGAGLNALQKGKKTQGRDVLGGALQGLGTYYGGKSLMGMGGGSQAAAGAAGIANSSVPGMKTSFLDPQTLYKQNMTNFGSPTPPGGGGGGGGGISSMLSNLFNRGGGGGGGGGGFNLGSLFNSQNILGTGLGIMGGSQLIRSPKVPQLPQSAIDYQNMARQGTEVGQAGRSALMAGLNQPFEQVSKAEEEAALRQLDLAQKQDVDNLTKVYKSVRYGSDPLTDSTWNEALNRINKDYAGLKTDKISELHRQVYNDYQGQQAQRIMLANNIDSNQLNALRGASDYDIEQALKQWGVDYQDAITLKDYLMSSGANILGMGIQKQLYPDANMFVQQGIR